MHGIFTRRDFLATASALAYRGSSKTGVRERAGQGKVYIVLWFDTEDYILPQSDDAAKRLAAFLTAHGVCTIFKVVGEKARTIERRGRDEVIRALAQHEIGFHSSTHSQHPTVAEYESLCYPLRISSGRLLPGSQGGSHRRRDGIRELKYVLALAAKDSAASASLALASKGLAHKPSVSKIPVDTEGEGSFEGMAILAPNISAPGAEKLHRLSCGETCSNPKIQKIDSLDLGMATPTLAGQGRKVLGVVEPRVSYLE